MTSKVFLITHIFYSNKKKISIDLAKKVYLFTKKVNIINDVNK